MQLWLRDFAIMRAMGWTRTELMEHSETERELIAAVLEYETKAAKLQALSMEHYGNIMSGS